MSWLIYTIIGITIFGISFIFEFIRDFYGMIWEGLAGLLEEILGEFGEGIIYVISFEWVGDIPEFFGAMFDDLGSVSVYGLAFAMMGTMLIYFTRNQMIAPFVKYYSPSGRVFWTIATYATVFIGGYLMGKFFENTG